MSRRNDVIALLVIILIGLALRLSTWNSVFTPNGILFDGPDAYYHLHRAAETVPRWPLVPQVDPFLNAPAGGVISWPPLFDAFLATLALPFHDSRAALEIIGALLPPILGVFQILMLFSLVRRIVSTRAGLAAAAVAAVLPAVVRYTMVGVLDHDPFFELSILVALSGIARAAAETRVHARGIFEVIAGCTVAVLCWGGSVLGLIWIGVISAAVAVSDRNRRNAVAATLSIGAAVAALLVLPFVLRSAWIGIAPFTFEGLSLLHETALVGLAFFGAVLTLKPRTQNPEPRTERQGGSGFWVLGSGLHIAIALVSLVALLYLLPKSVATFTSGARYAAGDSPILELVAEGRPLLFLLGPFDLKPLLIRLGLLPIIALILIPRWIARPETRLPGLFVGAWVAMTLPLALLHSRFSFSAAIALSAFAGIAFDDLLQRETRRRATAWAAALLILLPCIAAYVPIPGWDSQNFFRRTNPILTFEMQPIASALRQREPGNVLSPWFLGHWIVWMGQRPVVISPMLSVGQSEFQEGMRFFFLEDDDEAMRALRTFQVRYLMVTPELNSIEPRARVSGIDPGRYLKTHPETGERLVDLRAYMKTIAARLTFWDAQPRTAFGETYEGLPQLREVLRSRRTVEGPFGPVPLVRVYEVNPMAR
jgi:asparagine N-glycosylation enzyme membrane subunit Stt3